MRIVSVFLLLFAIAAIPAFSQRHYDFSGAWKLEMPGASANQEPKLDLTMEERTLTGTLRMPYGEFPIENGHAQGDDLFFNVVIERDEYKLKTTYRGHRFGEEIQFTVEAGERTLQVIARRAE